MASTTKKSGKKSAKSAGKSKKGGATARLTIVHPDVDLSRGSDLPAGTVKLSGENGLTINVQKLSTRLIRDQRAKLVSSMGCISNPGGPGC